MELHCRASRQLAPSVAEFEARGQKQLLKISAADVLFFAT